MHAGGRCPYGGVVSRDRQPLGKRIEEWSRRYHSGPVGRQYYRLPVVLWRLGLGPLVGRGPVLLTVTGRSTGLPRHTPVTPHVVGGQTYIWCPYGRRSQWYRNLMANPVVTVQSYRGTQVMRAVSIEDDDEAVEVVSELRRFDVPFLRLYLRARALPTPRRTSPGTGGGCTSGAWSPHRRRDHPRSRRTWPGSGSSR